MSGGRRGRRTASRRVRTRSAAPRTRGPPTEAASSHRSVVDEAQDGRRGDARRARSGAAAATANPSTPRPVGPVASANAARNAMAWRGGSRATPSASGRSSWYNPEKASSASTSIPVARSTRKPVRIGAGGVEQGRLAHTRLPQQQQPPPAPSRAPSRRRWIRARSTSRPSNTSHRTTFEVAHAGQNRGRRPRSARPAGHRPSRAGGRATRSGRGSRCPPSRPHQTWSRRRPGRRIDDELG